MANKVHKPVVTTKFLLSTLALLLLSASCQPTVNDSAIKSTEVSTIVVPTIQTRIPPTETAEVTDNVSADDTVSKTSTPILDNTTGQPAEVETPTSLPSTVTEINLDVVEFDSQIAFLGQQYPENHDYLIGVLDVPTNGLEIIADDETTELGVPMWSPEKDRLAFTRSDDTAISIQISDPADSTQVLLELEGSQLGQGDSNGGNPFLFGWSSDAEWLAYAFIYPTTEQDIYLINVQTKENILINNPDSIWFSWSPHNDAFVFTDSEALYIGDIISPNDLRVYQGKGYVGLMSWHPLKNELLVGISDNIAGDLNQLWRLNVDSGEWLHIGKFPELAHYKYSPNGESIAIHLQDRLQELNRLVIVEDKTGTVMYETELPNSSFFDLKWVDNTTIGLTTRDNIYI